MRKLRHICSLFALVCITILAFSYQVEADDSGNNNQEESCNIYFDVDFTENWFFDKYDLELYLDNTKIGTLAHGKPYTKLHSTTTGKHTITFFKDEDHSVKNSEDIEITKDGTLKCHVEAHTDSISLNDIVFSDSITGNSLTMINTVEMVLSDAYSKLEEIGFANITEEGVGGEVIIIRSNWTVVTQNIEVGKQIDKNEKIVLKCKKIESSKSDNNFRNKTEKSEVYALNSAEAYLEHLNGISKNGLIDQLEWEGYSQSEIDYAIEHCGTNWGEQAVKCAKSYLSSGSGFSKKGLISQLKYEKFGDKSINYAIEHCGANWGEQAVKCAKSYLSSGSGFSKKELKSQLKYEKFGDKSINYAIKHCGANWGQQAVLCANGYISSNMGFSKKELKSQLKYEGFKDKSINYALKHCDVNWKEQAAISAEGYMDSLSLSKSELRDQLEYEGYTSEQIKFGLKSVGY